MANKEFNNVKITSEFEEASSRENIQSGETIGILFGKIKKWFSDLKSIAFSGSYNDLSNKPAIPTKTSQLTNDSGFKTTDTIYTHPTTSGNKHIPSGGSSGQVLCWSDDGTAIWGNDNDTWIELKGATTSTAGTAGYVPAPAAGTANRYLRSDGTWQVPPNTTYTSLKNPYTLTLQFNGTTNKTYDGSSAQTLNITPSAIGAASASHSHNYIPLDGSDAITGSLKINTNKRGIYLTDVQNNQYPAIWDDGANLWFGATAAASEHHYGGTYISTGYNGTTGNSTIFLSVPNENNNDATNYSVLHSGNTSFIRNLTTGTKIGTIKVNGTSTEIYAPTNTDSHVQSILTNPSTETTYFPIWVTGTTTGTVGFNNGFRYSSLEGTENERGVGALWLGNGAATGTAGNKLGQLRLYSASTGAGVLVQAPTTSYVTHTLPTTNGTILNSGTTSFTRTITSGTKIGTIKINNSSTDIYAPSSVSSATSAETVCIHIEKPDEDIINEYRLLFMDDVIEGAYGLPYESSYCRIGQGQDQAYIALGSESENSKIYLQGASDYLQMYNNGAYVRTGNNVITLNSNNGTIPLVGKVLNTNALQNPVNGPPLYISTSGQIGINSSSRRTKTNINYDIDKESYHNILMNFKSAEFEYKYSLGITELGMIAEDVEELSSIAALYEYKPIYDDKGEYIGEKNTGLVSNYKDRAIIQMLIMEAQRKEKEITELTKRISLLENCIYG